MKWAGIMGLGWVHIAGYPQTIKPYNPGGLGKLFPKRFDLKGFGTVAQFGTKLDYRVTKAPDGSNSYYCDLNWFFTYLTMAGGKLNREFLQISKPNVLCNPEVEIQLP